MKLRHLGVIAIGVSATTTVFCLAVAILYPWPATVPGLIGAAIGGGLLILNIWLYRRNKRLGLNR